MPHRERSLVLVTSFLMGRDDPSKAQSPGIVFIKPNPQLVVILAAPKLRVSENTTVDMGMEVADRVFQRRQPPLLKLQSNPEFENHKFQVGIPIEFGSSVDIYPIPALGQGQQENTVRVIVRVTPTPKKRRNGIHYIIYSISTSSFLRVRHLYGTIAHRRIFEPRTSQHSHSHTSA